MLPVVLALLIAVPEVPPPERKFSVVREVVLLSGVALSVTGTALVGYTIWKEKEWSTIASPVFISVGSVISLGTAFTSHRWESPPLWVFFFAPVLGAVAGLMATLAIESG